MFNINIPMCYWYCLYLHSEIFFILSILHIQQLMEILIQKHDFFKDYNI